MVSPAKQEQVWQSILKEVPWPGGNTQQDTTRRTHQHTGLGCHGLHHKVPFETKSRLRGIYGNECPESFSFLLEAVVELVHLLKYYTSVQF